MKKLIIIALTLLFCLPISAGDFEVHRGINISHWLSQSDRRGAERVAWFTEDDVKLIAGLGFDHIRIPIDEEQMFDENLEMETEAFQLLHSAISWCEKAGLKVLVDLHILRSHYFNAKEKPLFTENAAQENFYECWRILSRELKRYPRQLLAFELMNEPVADDPETWNTIVNRCLDEVRKIDRRRTVVIGANRWQSFDMVEHLRVPEKDKNVILSFHFYEPFALTHYHASWDEGMSKLPCFVQYPGEVIPDHEWAKLTEAEKIRYEEDRGYFDRSVLESMVARAVAAAEKSGRSLYLGEFGVLQPGADEKDALCWYRDLISVCDQFGVAYASWDYKGGFGLFYPDGSLKKEMADILTGKY